MLNLFDTRLRGRVPALAPDGAVVERDGPIVRTHYGTHGAVDHGPLPEAGLDALVARQVEAFARRNEPVVWPVYAHDHGLSECLRAAGFTAGPARAVLVCPIGTDRADLRVHKGLRAAVAPGEELYWLDWHHVGTASTPRGSAAPGRGGPAPSSRTGTTTST